MVILYFLNVDRKLGLDKRMIKKFVKEINIERLKNNPVKFNKKEIKNIYLDL